jgi:hypothetical protein
MVEDKSLLMVRRLDREDPQSQGLLRRKVMILEVKDINIFRSSHIPFNLPGRGGRETFVWAGTGRQNDHPASIMGLTPPKSGAIHFKGQEISEKPVISRLGSVLSPHRRIFPSLTVREQLEWLKKARVTELENFCHVSIGRLKTSWKPTFRGEQQMLTIGRP